MKGLKKCFGLLLLLFIIFMLSSVESSSVNALQHEYVGVPFFNPLLIYDYVYDSESGLYSIDWDNSGSGFDFSNFYPGGVSGFYLSGFDDSTYYDGISFVDNMTYIHSNRVSSACETSQYKFQEIGNTYFDSSSPSYYSISIAADYYDPRLTFSSGSQYYCIYHLPFSSEGPQFSLGDSFWYPPDPVFAGSDGFVHTYVSPLAAYVNAFRPYFYTYDGFYTHHTSIDTESGIHYNHSFSFSDLVNKEIHHVNYLRLPLYSYDEYWTNPNNFYAGRQLKWVGVFDFDEPVSLNLSPSSNSHFYVDIAGVDQNQDGFSQQIPCTLNYRSVADLETYRLEYTCEGFLNSSLIFAYPTLELYDPDQNIFTTTGDWRWNTQFLVTDDDETPGQSFSGLTSGLGTASAPGPSEADFYSSLIHLFTFGFMNPFAPIFQMFDSGDQCVSIPTVASMIHSNESRVCPWFDSTTRNIVTPVLGFSSMMLLFGFAVRWLGGSSGNFFDDSSNESLTYADWYKEGRKFKRTNKSAPNRRINK